MAVPFEPGVLLKFVTGFSFVISNAPRAEFQHGLMINVYLLSKSTSLMVSLAVGDIISSRDNCEDSESR